MAANLKAKISLDTASFNRSLSRAISSVGSAASKMRSTLLGVGAAFASIRLAKDVFRVLDVQKNLRRIGADLDGMRAKFSEMGLGLVEGLSPSISAIQKFLDTIDFDGIGRNMGEALQTGINVIVNAFKDGKVGELIGLSLQLGIAKGTNFMIGAFNTAIKIIGATFKELFSADFLSSFVTALAGIGKKISAALIGVFTEPLVFFSSRFEQAAVDVAKAIGGVFEKLGIKFKGLNDAFMNQTLEQREAAHRNIYGGAAKREAEEGDVLLSEAAAGLQNGMANISKAIIDLIKDFKPGDVFDEKSITKKLLEAIEPLKRAIGDTMEATPWATDYDGQKVDGTATKNHKTGTNQKDHDRFGSLGLFTGNRMPSSKIRENFLGLGMTNPNSIKLGQKTPGMIGLGEDGSEKLKNFIGMGTGNSMINYARRTADGIQTLNKNFAAFTKQQRPQMGMAGAVWGD